MTDNVKAAKKMVICLLRDMMENGDVSIALDLFDVQSDDLNTLYQHIKALSNILNNAKKDIEEEINKNV